LKYIVSENMLKYHILRVKTGLGRLRQATNGYFFDFQPEILIAPKPI
jgi:hypothetical protein